LSKTPLAATMNDLDTLRQAQLLLGQYGFIEEQDAVAKAIRIISATARRLSGAPTERARTANESSGDRLKRLRERVGLSRAEIADLCGVVMSTVRAHENGRNNIPFEAAQAYAKALGTTTSMVLYGTE
jgi:DNA-binding transcriptional regulator YiaG